MKLSHRSSIRVVDMVVIVVTSGNLSSDDSYDKLLHVHLRNRQGCEW